MITDQVQEHEHPPATGNGEIGKKHADLETRGEIVKKPSFAKGIPQRMMERMKRTVRRLIHRVRLSLGLARIRLVRKSMLKCSPF